MASANSERATLIAPDADHATTNHVQNKDTYDTFSKPSVQSSVNQDEDIKELSSSGHHHHHVVYGRRWYIMVVFSFTSLLQSAAWNTWGPIADIAKPVLDWTDADIALLVNMGCITYLLSALYFAWLLDTKGIRITVLISSTLLMVGLAIRCVPVTVEYAKWTMNVGALLIGFAAPGINSGPPLVSAVWFPPHQRTTATAVMASSAYLGVAASFLIGPLIVSDVLTENGTSIIPANHSVDGDDMDPVVRNEHLREINTLLYIECAAGVFLCILVWAYYPAKPPTPPSASATVERKDFKSGIATLCRSRAFWMPALAFASILGVFNVWSTQFDTIFQHQVDVGQKDAGWIGFYSNVAGTIGSLIFARISDYLGGQMKKILVSLTVAAAVCFTWFLLLCLEVISFNLASLYTSCIVFSILVNATVPIYFEITVEGVYPVAEGITTGLLTWIINIDGLIFLLVLMIPNVGISWMNWTMLACVLFAIPCLLFYKEHYNRSIEDNEDTMSDEEGLDEYLGPAEA